MMTIATYLFKNINNNRILKRSKIGLSGLLLFLFFILSNNIFAARILIPMDAESQSNHLKAYGLVYYSLENQLKVNWLLNYRGGSFLIADSEELRKECRIRGVDFELISEDKSVSILEEISSPSQNMESVSLEKAPKI